MATRPPPLTQRLVPGRQRLLQRVVDPDLAQQCDGQPLIQQVHQHRVLRALRVVLGAQPRCVAQAAQLQSGDRFLREGGEGPDVEASEEREQRSLFSALVCTEG